MGFITLKGAARTKDCGADPHMGRAKADRLLEIGAHSHAENAKFVAPGDFAQKRRALSRIVRPGTRVLPLSGVSGAGLDAVLGALMAAIEQARGEPAALVTA